MYTTTACLPHALRPGKQIRSRSMLAWSRAFTEAIVEPKRASTPGDTRLPRVQARRWQFITGGVSKLRYATGKTAVYGPVHEASANLLELRCTTGYKPPLRAEASAYFLEYWPVWAPRQSLDTPPVVPCHVRACARGKRVSPGVEACLGSTIASMKSLDHANTRLLVICPYEVRAVNKRRWCI